jgi:hypothetical protein
MGGSCSTYGEIRNVYNISVRKLERKRPLGRPRSRWEDNIRTHLKEIYWKAMVWFIWLRIGTSGRFL